MGRKNRRSNRKMNRRSKRSNMRGGSNITMVVKNVGTQVVYLSWYNPKTRKWSGPEARGGGGGWSVPTYTGAQWRVKGNGKELSWVLADDGSSKQVIHVDLSPSKCSLTWNPIDDVGKAGLVQTDAGELASVLAETEALRSELGHPLKPGIELLMAKLRTMAPLPGEPDDDTDEMFTAFDALDRAANEHARPEPPGFGRNDGYPAHLGRH